MDSENSSFSKQPSTSTAVSLDDIDHQDDEVILEYLNSNISLSPSDEKGKKKGPIDWDFEHNTEPYTEEITRKLDRIDKLISWFFNLRAFIYSIEHPKDSDYSTAYGNDLTISTEKAKKCLDLYEKTDNFYNLPELMCLDNQNLAVVAICIATLMEDNQRNINFTNICASRIDYSTYCMMNELVANPPKDQSDRINPLFLIKRIGNNPTVVLLGLTLMWLKDGKFNLRVRWKLIEEALADIPRDHYFDKFRQACHYYIKPDNQADPGLGKVFTENMSRMVELMENLKQLLTKCRHQVNVQHELSFLNSEEVEKCMLTEEEQTEMRKGINQDEDAIQLLVSEEANRVNSQECVNDVLMAEVGEYVLVRCRNIEHQPFVLAKVMARSKAVSEDYTVKYCASSIYSSVRCEDIAPIKAGMYEESIAKTTYIGLRVACYVEPPSEDTAPIGRWLAGTIGGRSASHGNEFLVFLDNGRDLYVKAPFSARDLALAEIREIEKKGANQTVADIEKQLQLMKLVAMSVQSFAKNALDRKNVHLLVPDKARERFIQQYMMKYPEWPLMRTSVGSCITVFTSIASKQKTSAYVLQTDRAFCVVRTDTVECTQYPCTEHFHKDERIYRGSFRIADIYIDRCGDNNLSKRSRNRLRRQFDTAEPRRRMPQLASIGETETPVVKGRSMAEQKRREQDLLEDKKKEMNFNVGRNKVPPLAPLEPLPEHEQCDESCLRGKDRDYTEAVFKKCSPLHVPMNCGWTRMKHVYQQTNKKGNTTQRTVVVYKAPCGKLIHTMKMLTQYLTATNSKLTIDLFSLIPEVDTESYVHVDVSAVMDVDYSCGLETMPIPAVNTINDEKPPKIEYTNKLFPYDETVDLSSINPDFCSGCSCEGDCIDPNTCECIKLTMSSYYNLPKNMIKKKFRGVYEYRTLPMKNAGAIYECNERCSCRKKTCHNRLVQTGIKYPIQLFKTAAKGWGLRTLVDIPPGTFICLYTGSVLTNDIAEKFPNDDQYFAEIDLNDVIEMEKMTGEPDPDDDLGFVDDANCSGGESPLDRDGDDDGLDLDCEEVRQRRSERQAEKKKREKEKKEIRKQRMFKWEDYFGDQSLFLIDAKKKGNIGRFLNHSCDPNVFTQHVMCDTHDLRLPWTAFFTQKLVKAGEELAWDYNYTLNDNKEEIISCNCGSAACRGRLL